MKIYTKSGDKGMTFLYGGTKISKANIRIESYGTVDELNSWIGVVAEIPELHTLKDFFQFVQSRLFDIGALLAADPEKKDLKLPELKAEYTQKMEDLIDQLDAQLEPLKNFILPGGDHDVAQVQVARTVCRRAERIVVLLHEQSTINIEIITFLNRLSDCLFILARYTAKQKGVSEIKWIP